MLQIVTFPVVDKKEWRTKLNFGKTMMQVWELLWLAKMDVSGQSDVD